MSDVMLLGVLRMPVPYPVDAIWLHQFVDRAHEAADRIEADAAEIERLQIVGQEHAAEIGAALDKAQAALAAIADLDMQGALFAANGHGYAFDVAMEAVHSALRPNARLT